MIQITDILFVIGRVLFGGFFIYNGVHHFTARNMLAGYAESKGVPLPGIAVPVTGLLLLGGGLSVLLGFYPVIGIALLVIFLAGVTPVMHDFWAASDEQRSSQRTQFLKNMALLGAVLMLLMIQHWPYALHQ